MLQDTGRILAKLDGLQTPPQAERFIKGRVTIRSAAGQGAGNPADTERTKLFKGL